MLSCSYLLLFEHEIFPQQNSIVVTKLLDLHRLGAQFFLHTVPLAADFVQSVVDRLEL